MSEIPIRPILEHYGWTLPPERIGWRTTKCYAHEDSHASARFTEDDGGYVTCMACGFAGDAIDVVKHYERVEFQDAVRRAEEISGSQHEPGGGRGDRGGAAASGTRSDARKRKYVPPRRRVS